MATIQIRKKSNKVWEHIPSDIPPFIISKFYFSADGLEFQVVEQGQSRRNKYLLANITVYDDTSGGVAETFSTMMALSLRLEALKYPAFFNEGESLIDAFTDLTDTPSSYTGQADKVVKVKTDETGLEFGDPSGFNLQINEEGETSISNVNRVEFANATVEDLGSGAVKVTPLGGGATPNLEAVLLEGSTATITQEFSIERDGVTFGYGYAGDEIEDAPAIYMRVDDTLIYFDASNGGFKVIDLITGQYFLVQKDIIQFFKDGISQTIQQSADAISDTNLQMPVNEGIATIATREWVEDNVSGGAVDSVNGQTGVVVLDAEDVGAIPLSGTTTGNPVTGDIEFDSNGVSLKQTIGDVEKEIRFSDDASILFRVTNTDTSEENLFTISESSLTISKIIQGQFDLSSEDPTNKLIYAQRQYVDDAVANLLPLTRQQFTYTSGAQTFTLTEEPSGIYAVFVNGQELNTDQFSIATNVLTIIDTLISGDKVNILYSGQPVGVIPSYTKVETDALLDDKISKHVGATYTTNAIQTVTQAEYDALTPDASTLYFII